MPIHFESRTCKKCGAHYSAQLSYKRGENILSSGEYCAKCFSDYVQPRDANGTLLVIGDRVMFPVASGGKGGGAMIRFGTIQEITVPIFGNAGFSRTLKIKPLDGDDNQRIFSHPFPSNCLYVNQLGAIHSAPEEAHVVRLTDTTNGTTVAWYKVRGD